jgi:hypothetical protein
MIAVSRNELGKMLTAKKNKGGEELTDFNIPAASGV